MQKAIPLPDLPGGAQKTARDMNQSIIELDNSIQSLRTNTIADYVQMNAATTGGLSGVSDLREYFYSIPTVTTRTFEAGDFTLEAQTWKQVITTEVSMPEGRNRFTLMASASVSVTTDISVNPSIWFAIYPGAGLAAEAPTANSVQTSPDGTQYRTRVGHGASSVTYTFEGRNGGTAFPLLRLWSTEEVTLGGMASLSYVLLTEGAPS